MVVGMQADNGDAPESGQAAMEARKHRRRRRTRRRRREDEKDRVLGTRSD